MDTAIPHNLGLDLVQQSDLFVKEALESFEEHFTWLDEILETAKAAFQSSQIQVLPKTPSARQRRPQRRQSELPSFIRRSSICVGKTLHFSETDNSSCNDENIPPEEESDGNTSSRYSTRSTRQRTVQISKARKQPARGKSKRKCSNLTSPQNGQVSTSNIEDSVSPAKEPLSPQKPLTDSNGSKTENNPITNAAEVSPNNSVASKVECEKQVSPLNREHRVDNSSYVIESENPSSDIPNIDDAQICEDTSKTDESKNGEDIPKTDDSQNCQDIAKTDKSENSEVVPKIDESQNSQDTVPIQNTETANSDSGLPSDTKSSSSNSEVSIPAEKSSSSEEVPQASSPERPRTRTRQMQRQAKAVAAALNDDNQTSDDSRPCTRSRARKRTSEEVENAFTTDTKRHCAEEMKESSHKDVASQELEDDADCEDSEDESESKVKSLINVHTTPSNLSTPKHNGLHSLLLNSSYSLANRSFNRNNYSLSKYVQNGTFTGSAQKNNTHSRLKILSNFGNFKSFLKKTATPIKAVTSQEIIELKKRELENKERKEKERMMKREEIQRLKLDEQKRKREERMRKVAETREIKMIQEQVQKDKKTKRLEEKFNTTDRIREEKLREDREKVRLRLKKQQEAEERRKIEEKERNRKRKEQEEEQLRQQSILQRKKEFEEQERLKKAAEEKRKIEEQRERKLEAEKDKLIDLEKRKRFEEEREKERLRFKAEREKELAKQRAERERYLKEKQKAQEAGLERIREMERERLLYEQSLQEKKLEKDQQIQKLLGSETTAHQKVVSHNTTITIENPTECSKSDKKSESYEMTPHKSSYNSYDIDDLKSDDSTDEESSPQKPIPKWAQGPELKIALFAQHFNPPNLDKIFPPVEIPDLNELFVKKKAHFNHRSSSAHWDSPILRSHLPVIH
ncbi:inner centromere protein A isoform X1 [Octopus sinensis]|uniref:Inner centromere protein A isoform X1 n=1 Tax=Octopus sinensis TaxID=2607531 RepID=A0A6P7SPF6_9MOLL|nr:inner centromere protein A isoform X1 [Octopus sinensis]